jgi:predicted permease
MSEETRVAGIIQDACISLRQIRRSPGFFGFAALLIAIGIAATTQIFTLVDAFFLRPLPVKDPRNLVQLFEQQPKRPATALFNYGFYRDLALHSSTLLETVGQMDTIRSLEHDGLAERVHDVAVTDNFFRNLGISPLLGRLLREGDNHLVVLSHTYWSHAFGSDPHVLNRSIRLEGHPYTIVGVAPEAFTGTTIDLSPDLWTLFADQRDFSSTPNPNLNHYVIEIIGRLRPGCSIASAQQEAATLWNRYIQESESANRESDRGLIRGTLEVHSIAYGTSSIRDQGKMALTSLLAGTGLLLLMVCANVGGLLLSRAIANERETAVRVALGANRARLLRQWLMETLFITLVGGSLGLVVAYAGMPMLMRWMPPAHGIGLDPGEIRTLAVHVSLDFKVALFSLAVLVLTAVLSAVAPAWKSLRCDVNDALKSTISDHRNLVFQSVLCGFQVMLCTTMLISSGLIVRSLMNLRASGTGFDRERVAIFSVDPGVRGYNSEKTWQLRQRVVDGVRGLPGVKRAALAYWALMRGIGVGNSIVFPGQTGGVINTSLNSVTPEYFDLMAIHFLAGRNFAAADAFEPGKLNKVVVNEAFVHKFLSGRSALGERFATGQRFVNPEYEIIGVVNDIKYRSLREIPPPIYYVYDFGPHAYPATFILHVKNRGRSTNNHRAGSQIAEID